MNAAIDGAFAGGATEVVVADSHAAMTNLRAENIDARTRLVQGKPRVLPLDGSGGLIAFDKEGNIALPFNSGGIYRGYGYVGQSPWVGIYR